MGLPQSLYGVAIYGINRYGSNQPIGRRITIDSSIDASTGDTIPLTIPFIVGGSLANPLTIDSTIEL